MSESARRVKLLRRAAEVAAEAREYLVDIGPTRLTAAEWFEVVDGLADLTDAIAVELGAVRARS